ncbi:MAG: prolyl oligopeptidase family serine peptidase [Bacteroidales bacterium]|nr:prolyl oligopeptidase family serine peptidase [Bacteroidales bacterium]
MKKSNIFLLLLIFLLSSITQVHSQKKVLTHDDIESWNRITEKIISDDGEYVAYKTEPWRGNSKVFLCNYKGDRLFESECGTDINISGDSDYFIFTIQPEYEHVRQLKLAKTKKEDMPSDILAVYSINSGAVDSIKDFKNYKIPDKWSSYIVYQLNAGNGDVENSEDGEEGDGDVKKESGKNGFELHLRNLNTGKQHSWPFVKEYFLAEESEKLVFTSTGNNDDFEAGLYLFDIKEETLEPLKLSTNTFKQIALTGDADKIAFLLDNGNNDDPAYSLYLWDGSVAEEVFSYNDEMLSENWLVSENGNVSFSDNGRRVFFGIARTRPERDSTILDEEYPDVDIWHGEEGVLHTVQVIQKDRELKRTYRTVYDIKRDEAVRIETEKIPDSRLLDKGDSDYVLLLSDIPYRLQSMWEGSPRHYDVYLLNIVTGERQMLKKDIRASVYPSPAGNYIVWFNYPDYSYYSYSINTEEEYRLTNPEVIRAENELNDVPNYAYPYGSAGWFEDDEALLVYDRYDIWKVNPENRYEPVNMTINGRENKISYRLINFDRDEDFINEKDLQYLRAKDEVSRETGYYSWSARRSNVPELLLGGKFDLSRPLKAENSDRVIYTKETFNLFPDILVSDLSFRKSTRISDANPQHKEFLSGSPEIYSWTSLDGKKLEGLLYKPENFDPGKKYPMIVNFYEKSSQGLFNHRTPELHRSTIDYHYYTSNGYVVFNPDVYYEDGYPGESAYNCVMPGVTALVGEGFIDPERIGAQGHSWGGYQVAYLATRTDMFAAIESGAPVVNMFSAYGGIRWWTGLNRSFQYEHTQSRIGGSIWEMPLRYIENSPLFTMDKVTTPILIMHNDKDGHVPWYQGIEYFIALRRLQKPVWMLNYTGEPHWPQKLKNKKDFQIRLSQFFAHYLKGEPMPKWMKEGVPATEKDYELGY